MELTLDERVGGRVRHFRNEQGWTLEKLALEVQARLADAGLADPDKPITGDVVRKWEKGKNQLRRHSERVEAVAGALGVSIDELLKGRIQPDREAAKKVPIRILGDLAAGNPSMATGNEEWLDIDAWETPENQRWGRRLRGESMMPILRPRDICVFEDRSAEPGEIIHAYHIEEAVDTIKLYKKRSGRVYLDPFSDDDEFESIDAEGWCVRGPLMEVHRIVSGVKVTLRSVDGSPLSVKDLLPFADKNLAEVI